MLNILLNLILLFVCQVQAMYTDEISLIKEKKKSDSKCLICAEILKKSGPSRYSIIKIVNQSGTDIEIKVTYVHLKFDHIGECTTDKYLKSKKNEYDYYVIEDGQKISFNALEIKGNKIIIKKDHELIIKPRKTIKHSKIWSSSELSSIQKIYVTPIISSQFSKIRNYFKSHTLIDVRKCGANIFYVNSDEKGFLKIDYTPNSAKPLISEIDQQEIE
ncbi:hypothetical protein M1446_02635 [Candidatus Dependentiae bacterium]|nr:hypothetical protein [Candidatus Dependentiae bacterium]